MVYLRHVTHWNHKNLIRGETKWIDRIHDCRDFDTVEEHNQLLIDNINKTVGEKDILYHLGDFALGGKESIYKFRKSLNVKNLHLVLGNHDESILKNQIVDTGKGFVNLQNLFSSVSLRIDKKIVGQNMTLSHPAMRVWYKGGKGAWCLFGHSHGKLEPYEKILKCRTTINGINSAWEEEIVRFKTMDVGIDTHPEFRPYSFDELKEEFSKDKYINLNLDHH